MLAKSLCFAALVAATEAYIAPTMVSDRVALVCFYV